MNSRHIKRQAEEHNNTFSQVKHTYNARLSEFLRHSNGNYLIHGGFAEQRRDVLLSTIIHEYQSSQKPVVVFSDSVALREALLEATQVRAIDRLFICNNSFRNYDFFDGMETNQIISFFSQLATSKGYRDVSETADYIGAFLRILKTQSPINLLTMQRFAQNTDESIADLAREVCPFDYNTIITTKRSGVNFRSLLQMTIEAFRPLTDLSQPTGFNITSAIHHRCVIYIQLPATNYEIYALYFKQVFEQLLFAKMTLVLDESLMLNQPEFLQTFETVKQRDTTVILACENIFSYKNTELKNYARYTVFLNGGPSTDDTQRVLKNLGEYTHFDVTHSAGNTPHLLISLFKTEQANITTYNRSKLIVENESGYNVVLKGHNGTSILVAKHLITA